MRVLLYALMFSIVFSFRLRAQTRAPDTDSLKYEKFITMVNANREQSYVTVGSGFGNLEPLILESKFSPSYFFSRNKKLWAVMINPQVQFRILNEKSLPIRTPSYRIYGTFYQELKFWKHTLLSDLFYDNALWHASFVHHSNGQDGPFYINESTQEVNFNNGDFSAEYLAFGISTYQAKEIASNYFSFRELKTSLEYYPSSRYSEGLKDRYGSYRLFVNVGIVGSTKNLNQKILMQWFQRSSLEVKLGWIFGTMEVSSRNDVSRRLIIDAYYKYYPVWFDEIAFFMRFYRGQDYYNIFFAKEELTNLSFGITSNIMNYKQAVKLFK
jgi:hypothetical protein